MRLLPKLVRGPHCLRLPLGNESAALVVQAMLSDTAENRQKLCLAAVCQDAALALWCLCRTANPAKLRKTDDIASWLADHLLGELRWTPEEIAAASTPTDADRAAYAELAAMAVSTARLAAALAEQHSAAAAPAAYLLGLVHAAPRWIASAGISLGAESPSAPSHKAAAEAASGFLPIWLLAELAAVERAKPSDRAAIPAALVKQARDALAGKSRRNQPLPLDLEMLAVEREATRECWLADSASVCILPALVERLARLEQLETEFQRTLEFEKVESLKELAYGAGHEINNPLANISARAQTLLMDERDPERRRKLAAINTQAFRAHEMIADMMLFARPPQLKPRRVDISALIRTLFDALKEQALAQDTQLAVCDIADVVAWADPVQLAVAVRALCTNSLEALGSGGRVQISALAVSADDDGEPGGGEIQITVADDGPGIPAEVRRHMFDPFYSGREAGRGLGFGLSKCWRIVTSHGGRIDVDGAPGGGTRITLSLPRFVEASEPLAGLAK